MRPGQFYILSLILAAAVILSSVFGKSLNMEKFKTAPSSWTCTRCKMEGKDLENLMCTGCANKISVKWEAGYKKNKSNPKKKGNLSWLKSLTFGEGKVILARNGLSLKYATNRDDYNIGLASDGSSPEDDDKIVLIYGMNWSATGGRITHIWPETI